MRRPTLLLLFKIKTGSQSRPIVVPIPLPLAAEILGALLAINRLVSRWITWQEQLGEYGPLLQEALDKLPHLLHELRSAGPFTLVEVNDAEADVFVLCRII